MKGIQLGKFEFLHFQFAREHETSSKNTMDTYETHGEGKSCFEFIISIQVQRESSFFTLPLAL